MIVVPQINYIIYMLPLNFPLLVLKKFNKIAETFLWSGKSPSLNRTKLYAAKEDGGLAMPRVHWYHYAFSLNQLSKIYGADGQSPAWVSIERELTEPFSIHAFMTQTEGEIPFNSPLLRFERETWRTSHQIVGSKPLFTRRSSLWNNKLLKVGRKVLFWRTWTEAGIIYIEDVLEGDKFISFEQMMTKYHIPKTAFWKYLQLRSCLLSMQKRTPLIKQTLVQEMIQASQLTKKTASAFYSLMRQSHPPGLSGLKKVWEEDLGGEISEEMWKDITGSWYKISREIQTRLIIYKIIHRCYWTPCKMAKLKLRDSDLCWRCHRSKGTLSHMLYDCHLTQNLWKTIIGFVNKVLGTKFVQNPALCPLGIGMSYLIVYPV
uniref:Reverse transcriptase zinc-binding domain-containing protein n=1 Tax=Amphiprion percula TaxID=161767 RepID=A0A3P8RUG3_AMPPE